MKLSAIVMTASAAAMFAVGSTFASSQTTSTPIQVESVRYVPSDSGDQSDDYDNLVDNGLVDVQERRSADCKRSVVRGP
jgi:hypothetical protein